MFIVRLYGRRARRGATRCANIGQDSTRSRKLTNLRHHEIRGTRANRRSVRRVIRNRRASRTKRYHSTLFLFYVTSNGKGDGGS